MVSKILKLYVIVTSIVPISFVLIFNFSHYFTHSIVRSIGRFIHGEIQGYPPIQFQIDNFCFFNGLFLLPLSIYLMIKRKWYGYLGLVSILLYAWHFYDWGWNHN